METQKIDSLADFDCPWRRVDVYVDEWRSKSASERDAIRLARLNSLLVYAKEKAEYYRELPADRLNSLSELRTLPILSNDDYREYSPPNGKALLADPDAPGLALASGGTTGSPRSCYRTLEEQHVIAVHLARGLVAAGIREGDVVANMMPPGNLWVPFISFTMALEHMNCGILPIGRAYSAEAAINWMNNYGVNVLLGYPAELARIALEAPKELPKPKIRLITTSGTPVYAGTERVLSETFGRPRFLSSGYASNDTGPMGFQCEHCPNGTFHLQEELQILEIVKMDSDEVVEKGERGRMLFTSVLTRTLPVIRYEIGDIGRWLDEDGCPCGRVQPRFQLCGRSNDILVGEASQLLPETVSNAVASVEGLSPEWQIKSYSVGDGEGLSLTCETLPSVSLSELNPETLREAFLQHARDLADDLHSGVVKELKVNIVRYGELPRSPRTGKITLFVDERKL